MNKKYCLIPDEEKFYSFLASLTFSPVELMQLKLMHINQICVDESACQWEVHFSCAAHLTGGLLQKAAQQLAAAFSLQSVDMICDGDGSKCQVMQREPQAEVEITDCTGEPLPEEIPLPPEPPDIEIGETLPPELPCETSYNNPEEDPDYLQAMAALYGEKKADGQLWGNPLYDWPYHKKTGYAWWVRRVRHALGIYDLLRIDHFRGFDTYWAIPADSTTARTGKWENGPGMELFDALEAALGKLPIIAEDLGELFPSVRKLLADSTFPGMKVLQFAFGGGDNEYLPHNHVKNSVVYPGTHDNTTLTDWWENGASEKEKAAAAAYLHLTGVKPTAKELAAIRTDDVRIALLRAALGSVADRAIIPMYDWLGLGAEAHLNTPGKLGGNWAWRAAGGFAVKALAKTIHDECSVYCRV